MSTATRTGLVWHERYMWHDTGNYAGVLPAGGVLEPDEHTENPGTKRRIKNLLDATGVTEQLVAIPPRAATAAELAYVHTPDYVAAIQEMSEALGGDARIDLPYGHTPFGAGSYAMCDRAYDPRFMWMWPNARISVMGGEQAATVLSTVKRDGMEAQGKEWPQAQQTRFENKIRKQYETQGHPYYASARLWDDGVIDPVDTRGILGHAISASMNRFRDGEAPYGIFRM